MRAWIGLSLLAGALLATSPAAAQDAEALRKELEEMRRQFDAMKDAYEKSINKLSDRIQAIESRPQPTAVAPVAAAPPVSVMAQASTIGMR